MVTEKQIKQAIINAEIDINVEEITTEQDLSEAGLDSLDFFNVFLEIEELTGKKVEDEAAEKLKSIQDIINYFS